MEGQGKWQKGKTIQEVALFLKLHFYIIVESLNTLGTYMHSCYRLRVRGNHYRSQHSLRSIRLLSNAF